MTKNTVTDEEQEALTNVAWLLDSIFNPDPEAEKHHFGLILFSPGQLGGSIEHWIPNGTPEQMVAAMREATERLEYRIAEAQAERDASKGGKVLLQ